MTAQGLQDLREGVGRLAAADPSLRRFGAAVHRYALPPPLSAKELASVEATLGCALPQDVRHVALGYARGGAGPGYGWIPLDRVKVYVLPDGARAIPLADYGCGQVAALALEGGAVMLDARGRGAFTRLHDSFVGWYSDWYVRLSKNAWPAELLDNTTCPLPLALSGYLAACEQEAGVPAGTLAGEALREALGRLGPGAIEIAADGPPELFDAGDVAEPCLACARLVASLVADGIRPDVIAGGVRPRPLRDT